MVKRRSGGESVVEKVAASISDEMLNLRPYLADGVDGVRRWSREAAYLLRLNGGTDEDVVPLMRALGFKPSDLYRAMLTR